MDSQKKINDKTNDKKITNMKYVGPGIWITIHFMAVNIDNNKSADEFRYYLNTINKTLPCMYCRNHMSDYMKSNALPSKITDYFDWTVKFHNSVNKRLGYQNFTIDSALDLYSSDNGVCTAECDDTIATPINSPKINDMKTTQPKGKPSFRIVSVY